VDYLIGLEKAPWHPSRYKRARFGGDLWIWSNNFGSCLGGSHPLINAPDKRSTSLYTIEIEAKAKEKEHAKAETRDKLRPQQNEKWKLRLK